MAYCAGRRTASSCFCFFSFAFFISRCAHDPLFFCLLSSWDERTKKVMSMLVFCNWFRVFPLSAGIKAMAKPILLSVLLLFFSFSFLCFVFFLYISALCFCSRFLYFWFHFSRFSSPFYRDSPAASFNQSCLCRTVICHERDRGRETWSMIGSNPLQIFSLLNRDGEDEHDCSTSNDNVSATMDIFILTPERFKLNNWDFNQ